METREKKPFQGSDAWTDSRSRECAAGVISLIGGFGGLHPQHVMTIVPEKPAIAREFKRRAGRCSNGEERPWRPINPSDQADRVIVPALWAVSHHATVSRRIL